MNIPDNRLSSVAKHFFENKDGLMYQLGADCTHADKDGVIAHIPMQSHFAHSVDEGMSCGLIGIAIDTLFGFCVLLKVEEISAIATIDLRIDHIQSPGTKSDITVEANCFAINNNIAYLRGQARESESQKLLASACATFMLGTRGPSFLI